MIIPEWLTSFEEPVTLRRYDGSGMMTAKIETVSMDREQLPIYRDWLSVSRLFPVPDYFDGKLILSIDLTSETKPSVCGGELVELGPLGDSILLVCKDVEAVLIPPPKEALPDSWRYARPDAPEAFYRIKLYIEERFTKRADGNSAEPYRAL